MAEQRRVPDLAQMNEQAAHTFLTELYSLLCAEAEDRIRHDEYTMEWPQSGERLRGREKMKAFQESNAGGRPPRWPRRVLVREGLWVVEGSVDYGGGRDLDFVLILELRDGKVFKETRYYAEPFEASEARARWFERMERRRRAAIASASRVWAFSRRWSSSILRCQATRSTMSG